MAPLTIHAVHARADERKLIRLFLIGDFYSKTTFKRARARTHLYIYTYALNETRLKL